MNEFTLATDRLGADTGWAGPEIVELEHWAVFLHPAQITSFENRVTKLATVWNLPLVNFISTSSDTFYVIKLLTPQTHF